MTLSIGCVTISFNQARFLRECVESVALSGQGVLHHVIVDPGSTDGSRDIIDEYARLGRFRACLLEPDSGPADGLNRGFARLDTDIVCYLNSDDRYRPGALDYAIEYFTHNPDVDVLIGAGRFIDESGRAKRRKIVSTAFELRRYLEGNVIALQQATFFRHRAFFASGGFQVENRISWDGELLVDMAIAGMRFRTVNRILGDFRVYPGTITDQLWSNGATSEQKAQIERLHRKIIAAGVREHPAALRMVRRWMHRLDPIRRALEFVVR